MIIAFSFILCYNENRNYFVKELCALIKLNGNTIHLSGKDISYVLTVSPEKDLLNFHFGKKIADMDYSLLKDECTENLGYATAMRSLDVYPQEYPAYGYTDLRMGAYEVQNKFGNVNSELHYKGCEILDGAPDIKGMPSLFSDGKGQTLRIDLEDEITGLKVALYYLVFDEYNIIARHAVLTNSSDSDMVLTGAFSANLDLPAGDYEAVCFTGTWAREREEQRTELKQGVRIEIDNARCTSHHVNPFSMLCSKGADETHGDVYGFSLIYSGNHATSIEVDVLGPVRVRQGINPFGFREVLKSGESFFTPQSVLCYSDCGFGKLSNDYHDVYRSHLMRSSWAKRTRPLLLNNWEGTYFQFTEEKLLEMAKAAKAVGLDLFVLDDGWFGVREDDTTGLGDWFVNYEKLPCGIDGLAKQVNDLGLMFGLWFEPEMVSPDSDLYRAHPDWIVRTPEREPILSRTQYILDLSRDEVCDYIIKVVSDVLENANVEYVKWDMNRQMTDMPYLGYNHKYTLGYYKIMSEITSRFPNVLFEGCCSGGGRFDPGVLAYMPQIWTSDNSDAVARLKIQYSTSMCYPVYSISSHVTASPNHQNGRVTPLKTRADVAYAGTFGYELDLTKLSKEELDEIKKQVEFDKTIQTLVRDGDFHRLISPYETNYCSWQLVSKEKDHALLFACKILAVASSKERRIRLRGLEPCALYREAASGTVYSGDMLMNRGIRVSFDMCDFSTRVLEFVRV